MHVAPLSTPASGCPLSYLSSDANTEHATAYMPIAHTPIAPAAATVARATEAIRERYHARQFVAALRSASYDAGVMRARRSVLLVATLAVAVSLAASAPAFAAPPDKTACAASYEQAQRLRRGKKLVKAREALLVCVQDSCPEILRTDCTTWLSQVDASLPTVVFEARGADGVFLPDVTVSSGGEIVVSHLDGNAIAFDPGERTLRFEHAGAKAIEQSFVVREGEKLQKIAVVFPDVGAPPSQSEAKPPVKTDAPPAPSSAPPISVTPSPTRDAGTPSAAIPWTVWTLGGVGVAGLGVFGVFAISGYSDVTGKLSRCDPNCPHADVQSVRTKYLIGDVGLVVGALALGGAAYIYFFGRDKDAARASVGASMTPGGARAFVGGSF